MNAITQIQAHRYKHTDLLIEDGAERANIQNVA